MSTNETSVFWCLLLLLLLLLLPFRWCLLPFVQVILYRVSTSDTGGHNKEVTAFK